MLQLKNKNGSRGPLWLVDQKFSLGKAASCDIKISKGGVQDQHAEIHVSGDSVQLVNLVGGSDLLVNGRAVSDKKALKAGDVLSIAGEEFELVDPKASAEAKKPKPKSDSGWAFKALNTALAEKHFALTGSHVLGRSQECDISLGVVHLSRKHAKVTVTDHGLKVEDLNSSNGTYINGKKVSTAHAIAGDEVSFDTLRFRVIGPVIDEDKTTVRSSSDGDLTTIRPAVKLPNVPGAKPASAAVKSRAAKPASSHSASAKPAAAVSSASNGASRSSSSSTDEGSNTAVIVIAALVVIGGAAAAFFAMK
ncbi:MAG: FHA domain-containing protein [Agarilytica sp.]